MSSEVVSVIFRLLNFGVACGVGAYVFKKNLLPGIKEKIAEQELAVRTMEQRNQDLLTQKKTVEREINEQEELGRKLYDQIKLWSFSFEKERARICQERADLDKNIEQRAREQAENKLKDRVQMRILKQALAGAREELSNRYASESEGKRMIADIISYMRKDMK